MLKGQKKHTPVADRFWPKVARSNGCWPWTGTINSYGYGYFYRTHGRPVVAHRIAWELTNGQIPKGLCLLHRCDNRRCVNPDHLFLGTKTDNARDRDSKGRNAKGARIGHAKLTDSDIAAIRAAYTGKYGEGTALMRRYGIGKSAFWAIIRRATWRHVP